MKILKRTTLETFVVYNDHKNLMYYCSLNLVKIYCETDIIIINVTTRALEGMKLKICHLCIIYHNLQKFNDIKVSII